MGSSTIQRRKNQHKSKRGGPKKEADSKNSEKRSTGKRSFPKKGIMEGFLGVAFVSSSLVLLLLLVVLTASIWWDGAESPAPVTRHQTPAPTPPVVASYTTMGSYELLETVPHDTSAFTQGLVAIQDAQGVLRLYEGTGMYGDSDLRILDLNGNVLTRHMIPDQFFGEGIAHFPVEEREEQSSSSSSFSYGLLQLTWREWTVFEYNLPLTELTVSPPFANATFSSTKNEGWGITYNPKANLFYVTDGSAYVHVWDNNNTPRTEIRRFLVTYQFPRQEAPVRLSYLNELEWDPVTGTILANVLGQDIIVRIDPETGFVSTVYNFDSVFPRAARPSGTDVFNGIALSYDLHQTDGNTDQEYWVTGKYWPNMYRVKLIDIQ